MQTETKREVAKKAVDIMGGPLAASLKIQSLSGQACSRERVQKWLINGIAVPWHPFVHQLTDIPLHELDSEIYPSFLFNN